MKKVLGIDEAGRGPVIGPLVMCGYLINERDEKKLIKLGVKDSKELTPMNRKSLASVLKRIASDFAILKLDACEIDKLRTVSNLNKEEIKRMQQMINSLEPDKVIIDALEFNTKRFKQKIIVGLNKEFDDSNLIVENFADKNYPVVSAASIIAKVQRDNEIEKIAKKYGFDGTGYPSDEKTIKFLKMWIRRNRKFPDFVRHSWFTAQYIKREREQAKLKDFLSLRKVK